MKRALVTESSVREAAGNALEIPADAIITPAARDLAEQLGVELRTTAIPKDRTTGKEPLQSFSSSVVLSFAVAVGADHGGYAMKEELKKLLGQSGHVVIDVGTHSTDAVDYPDFAVAVARAVAGGQARFGIMVDGAGIGSSMAANKIPGVRAALCHDVTTAQNAREHNNANVLTLGGSLIGQRLAGEIVKTFLSTDFGGGRHQARVDKIDALD